MRAKLAALIALAVLILLGIACSDDDSNGTTAPDVLTIADLAGTWSSTSWTFESHATGEEVDMTALGLSITIEVEESGRYTLTIVDPEENVVEHETGTLSIEDGTILIARADGDDDGAFFTITKDGDTFQLVGPDEDWDFDNDQVEEPATMRLEFTRV